MHSGYRIGSTMEFAGYDATTNPRRLDLLRRGAAPYLREPVAEPVQEQWWGWRPMVYDGRPIIGGGAVELLHRGAFGREATRLADGVFDLLTEGGFASEDLGVCFNALFTHVTGYVDPAADADVFAAGLQALIAGLEQTMGPRS